MIILTCVILLIVTGVLHISGGNKEHGELLLELIKQPVNKAIYNRVYFDNNLAIEIWSDRLIILKKWMWSAYHQIYIYDSYEKLYPTYNTHRKVKKFIDRKSTRLNSSHSAKSRMPSSA